MLPETKSVMPNKIKFISLPTKTISLDLENNQMKGTIDGLQAVAQAAACILQTERYDYCIYSWNYGIQLKDLYGKPISYVKSEVKRRIKEALIQDDRISDVDQFVFKQDQNKLHVTFTIYTVYGQMIGEKEVIT